MAAGEAFLVGLGEPSHGGLEVARVRDDVAPRAAAITPTVSTTGSKMSKRRVTIVCSEVIISAVAAIGSCARCGIDP